MWTNKAESTVLTRLENVLFVFKFLLTSQFHAVCVLFSFMHHCNQNRNKTPDIYVHIHIYIYIRYVYWYVNYHCVFKSAQHLYKLLLLQYYSYYDYYNITVIIITVCLYKMSWLTKLFWYDQLQMAKRKLFSSLADSLCTSVWYLLHDQHSFAWTFESCQPATFLNWRA